MGRVSLPVVCDNEFIDEEEKAQRWEMVRLQQQRMLSGEVQAPPSIIQSSLVDTGFDVSDIQNLTSFDETAEGELEGNKEALVKGVAEPAPAPTDSLAPPEAPEAKKRSKSPFRFFSKKREASANRSKRGSL